MKYSCLSRDSVTGCVFWGFCFSHDQTPGIEATIHTVSLCHSLRSSSFPFSSLPSSFLPHPPLFPFPLPTLPLSPPLLPPSSPPSPFLPSLLPFLLPCHIALEKVALLIGNQNYESPEVDRLVSPENDIRELCKLLQAPPLNFKVISLVNLKYREMMKALEEFYQMLAVPGVYALFYYSGHGFNYLGHSNYLIPVDATLPLVCEHNIEANAIGLGMQSKLSRAMVVLDCCKIRYWTVSVPHSTGINGK